MPVKSLSSEPLLGRDETTTDVVDGPPSRKARMARRAGHLVLGLVVLAAAFDVLGPQIDEVSAEEAGYRLSVEYPKVTRAGQPAPVHLTIEADGGFGKTVQVRLCDEFFNDLDFQQWYPNPAAESTVPPWIVYEFDPPPTGDTLEVSLDARTAPGQFGELDDCEVAVLEDDEPVVATAFTVWRMP